MKRIFFFSIICISLAATSLGESQAQVILNPGKPIVRERKYPAEADQVWKAAIVALSNSKAVIGTADKASGLIAYNQILHGGVAHTTLLIKPAKDRQTRVYVNTRFVVAERFLNSDGKVEEEVFINLAQVLNELPGFSGRICAQSFDEVWEKSLRMLSRSKFVLNFFDRDLGIITFTSSIKNDAIGQFAKQQNYTRSGNGSVYFTLFIRAITPTKVEITMSALFFALGFSLDSNGQIEMKVLNQLCPGLPDDAVSFPWMTSDGIGAIDVTKSLWQRLFDPQVLNVEKIKAKAHKRNMPASYDQVWEAALTILKQVAVIKMCDKKLGQIVYLNSHEIPPTSESQIAVVAPAMKHSGVVLVEATAFETICYSYISTIDDFYEDEIITNTERESILNKIATQLFADSKFEWLIRK